VVGFALIPQLDLWSTRGGDYNGVFAVIDYDEPFYAAYIQSQIDNKPLRNSPFSGAIDTVETPQNDSYLSIQFLATTPAAAFARTLGLSISTTMILVLVLCVLVSTFVIFNLFLLITKDPFESFVGTIGVLFLGAVAGGQGGLVSYFFEGNVQYSSPLLFLRRMSPAASFPVLFFFFAVVWKLLSEERRSRKMFFTLLASCSFAFLVYSYFYHWTTAAAWIVVFIILLGIFRSDILRANKLALFILGFASLAALIPYALQILNRANHVDSALFLEFTRETDLFRIPELLSYATLVILIAGRIKGLVDFRDLKILFVISLALISLVVFNQQIVTGRSLQAFHYELFCANYAAVFSLLMARLVILKQVVAETAWRRTLVHSAIAILLFACFDTVLGLPKTRPINVTRDQLLPIAEKVRELNAHSDRNEVGLDAVLLSFDFTVSSYINSNDFPALASQPILWSPHLPMFPEIGSRENRKRLFTSLYYQGFDKARLLAEFTENPDSYLAFAVFGGERVSKLYTGKVKEISADEIGQVVEEFERFRENFDFEMASDPRLSFVLVNKETEKLDLSFVDRWYERDAGEQFEKFTLYRVRLRDRAK
jgi:hypothetical protein